jgi:phytoene dehydrogenase-like protein
MLLKTNDMPQSSYDIIVIGGGLGGLTSANLLARQGKKVLLVEAHNKLGGFATWFHRKSSAGPSQEADFTFDISLHGFPSGMIKTCKKYWNLDLAKDIVKVPLIRFVNPQFQLTTDFTEIDYARHLEKTFGVTSEVVKKFFEKIRTTQFFDDPALTTGKVFETFFPGRNDIHRFLMEPITYANGSTLEDPFLTYCIVFGNFMKDGVFTFKGPTDNVIAKMRQQLLDNGVDIKLNAKVSKIILSEGLSEGVSEGDLHDKSARKVEGVFIKQKDREVFVKAKVVISNAHLKTTLTELVGTENLPAPLKVQVEDLRLNSSSCQVYLGFAADFKIDPDWGELVFTSTAETYTAQGIFGEPSESRTYSVYHRTPNPIIVASTNNLFKDWVFLNADDYEAQKNRLLQQTLSELENFLPGARAHLLHAEVATPLTVKRYTLHPEGTSFGTKFEGLQISRELPQTFPGLYHAGSVGIIMSGWLGAANYGVMVAHDIERTFFE